MIVRMAYFLVALALALAPIPAVNAGMAAFGVGYAPESADSNMPAHHMDQDGPAAQLTIAGLQNCDDCMSACDEHGSGAIGNTMSDCKALCLSLCSTGSFTGLSAPAAGLLAFAHHEWMRIPAVQAALYPVPGSEPPPPRL
ncbi:hypothetical protein ACSHT0_16330 [Tepidicaulis sp. LMO-SS28]|uniref:hypothetical protein n=1 Tax=Tepidicaulis sp. LMO-SS28 TaxID=3447455 RepID=UPI003EE3ACD3